MVEVSKDGLLPVTQADRDAAAARLRPHSEHDPVSATIERIRSGRFDGHSWVQAFARHRIEVTATLQAERDRYREALEAADYRACVAIDAGAEIGQQHELRAGLNDIQDIARTALSDTPTVQS